MNPVTAEKLNAEAWIEQHATHTCPHFGGRFKPQQCKQRKAKAKRIAERHSPGWDWVQASSGHNLSKCLECDGPIPISFSPGGTMAATETATNMYCQICKNEPADEGFLTCGLCRKGTIEKPVSVLSEFPIVATKQQSISDRNMHSGTYRCKKCGKTGTEKFYPSVRNYCKKCCAARDKERHASRPKKYSLIVDQSEDGKTTPKSPKPPKSDSNRPKSNQPENPMEATSVCRTCGNTFAPYVRGCIPVTRYCKDCVGLSAKQNASIVRLLFNPSNRRDQQVLEKLQHTAKAERRTLEQQIVWLVEKALAGMEAG